MPTTVIALCVDVGCNCPGDKVTLQLDAQNASIAADPDGHIFGTILDFQRTATGTKNVNKYVYDSKTCKTSLVEVCEVQYEYRYTVSYDDDQTVPAGEVITADQVERLCCLGCGIDYILNQIQTNAGTNTFLSLPNTTFTGGTGILHLELTDGSSKDLDLSTLADTNTTYTLTNPGTSVIRLTGSDGSTNDIDICALVAANCPGGGSETITTLGKGSDYLVTYTSENATVTQFFEDRERNTVTQTAHGFTLPAGYGILPLAYDSGGAEYVLAQADDETTTADVLAVALPDANTITLQEGGHIVVPGHGLSVGAWYALDPAVAGNVVLASTLNSDTQILQHLFFVESASVIAIRPQEAIIPCPCDCDQINQTAHGFSEGDLVSYDTGGGNWVPAVAGYMAFFVDSVVDVDNFTISRDYCSNAFTGAAAGIVYAIDPTTPGAVVDLSTLDPDTDPITVIGSGTDTADCLIGRTEAPYGQAGAPPAQTVFEEYFENGGGAGCGFDTSGQQDTLQSGGGPFFHTQGVDSSCSMQAVQASGGTGGEVHRVMFEQWASDLDCCRLQFDFLMLYEPAATFVGNRICMLTGSDGAGNFDGPRVEFNVQGGFNLRLESTDTQGAAQTFNGTAGGIISNDTWYRVTLDINLGTPSTADGAFRMQVDELGGDRASGAASAGAINVADVTFNSIQFRNGPLGFDAFRAFGAMVHSSNTTIDTYQLIDNVIITDACNI